MSSKGAPFPWLWQWSVSILTVILGGGVLLWIAICCGWNAPRPSQPPDWEAAEPIVLRVAAPEQQAVELLGEPVAEFTVEIDAVPQGESTFNGYGLIFRAQSPDRYAVFAVGSDGYVAVLARDDEQETPWLDWRAFPHVRRGEASNRLRVTCGAGECHFWVNDEHVASLPDRLGPTGRVGVWASRQTRAPLEVTFNALSVWEEIP